MSLAARVQPPPLPPGQDELPYDDGEPMENPRHRAQMNCLIETLQRHFEDRPDIYIGGNMGLYYSELQARNNDFRAPDFFVVLNAIPGRERKSWVVWQEEGRRPDVVIELISPSTEREDRGRKMQVYNGLGVSEYYLYDPETTLLEGYERTTNGYLRMQPRPDGDLQSSCLGLRLGVVEGSYLQLDGLWLRWKRRDGTLLPTFAESHEAARRSLETAEARAARLEARLRALGVEPE